MESEARGPCRSCGARVAVDAEWCGRCHTPVADPVPPSFARADAYLGPPVPRQFSRWRKSDVTFGPLGRIAASILLCAVPIWWAASFSFVMLVMWVFFVSPMVLRSIWRKTQIRD